MSDKKHKRDPEQLPALIKRLLNDNGYDSLRQALEDAAKRIKQEHSEEINSDKE